VLLIFSALVGIHIYFIYAVYGQSPSTPKSTSASHEWQCLLQAKSD